MKANCGCIIEEDDILFCAEHHKDMLITGNTFIELDNGTIHTKETSPTIAFGESPFKGMLKNA